jgi:hypothetical protein
MMGGAHHMMIPPQLVGETTDAYKMLVGNPERRDNFCDRVIDNRIIQVVRKRTPKF